MLEHARAAGDLATSTTRDGHPDSFKTCLRCVRLRASHRAADQDADGDCNPVFGELLHQIGECCREDASYLRAFRAAWREGESK